MNKTMQHYYTKVNEVTRLKAMPSILACAAEVLLHLPEQSFVFRCHPHSCIVYVLQYSELPIQPTDNEDMHKLLNAPELAELKTRVRTRVHARDAKLFQCFCTLSSVFSSIH